MRNFDLDLRIRPGLDNRPDPVEQDLGTRDILSQLRSDSSIDAVRDDLAWLGCLQKLAEPASFDGHHFIEYAPSQRVGNAFEDPMIITVKFG